MHHSRSGVAIVGLGESPSWSCTLVTSPQRAGSRDWRIKICLVLALFALYLLSFAVCAFLCIVGKWWARKDLNLRPAGYEPDALTIELRAQIHFLLTYTPIGPVPVRVSSSTHHTVNRPSVSLPGTLSCIVLTFLRLLVRLHVRRRYD